MRAGFDATRAIVSNGWTLRCSCRADDSGLDRPGSHVVLLEQERRGPQGFRRFLSRRVPCHYQGAGL